MPELSRFYGIVIQMYYADHEPAHFHARYHDYIVVIEVSSLAIVRGKLPPRALSLVLEWAYKHQDELMIDWKRARNAKELLPIDPLV